MSSPRPSRALALILALVPGWGHVYLAHEVLGLALFTVAALSAFGLIDLLLLYQGAHRLFFARSAGGLCLLLWLGSFADVWRRTSPVRQRRIGEEKAQFLRVGMIAYLRDDLDSAEEAFRACLSLDRQEVEALMRLGVVLARRRQVRAAHHWLVRARLADLDEKWRWEIDRELARLRAAGQGSPKSLEPGTVEAPPPPEGEAARPAVPVLEPPSAARE